MLPRNVGYGATGQAQANCCSPSHTQGTSKIRQSRGPVTVCSACARQLQDYRASSCLFATRVMPYCPLCVQAAHSINVSASVCLAQVEDAKGDTRSALKYWAKAAKLGHPEAQFRLGRVRLATVIDSCCCASVCLYKKTVAHSSIGRWGRRQYTRRLLPDFLSSFCLVKLQVNAVKVTFGQLSMINAWSLTMLQTQTSKSALKRQFWKN